MCHTPPPSPPSPCRRWDVVVIEGWYGRVPSFIASIRRRNPFVVVVYVCLDTYPSPLRFLRVDADAFVTNSRQMQQVLSTIAPTQFMHLAVNPREMYWKPARPEYRCVGWPTLWAVYPGTPCVCVALWLARGVMVMGVGVAYGVLLRFPPRALALFCPLPLSFLLSTPPSLRGTCFLRPQGLRSFECCHGAALHSKLPTCV